MLASVILPAIVTRMRGLKLVVMAVAGALYVMTFGSSAMKVFAVSGESPLIIGQVKITSSNGQFITLYNNSAETIDMSGVQLVYYNNYDLSKATSNKFIGLSGNLAPGNYYLISDGALMVCYRMTVNATSLGFSSTSGMVQVLRLTQTVPGGLVASTLMDSLAWSKTTAQGAQTLPAAQTDFLQRVWPNGTDKTTGGGTWQIVRPDPAGGCTLEAQLAASSTPSAPQPSSSIPVVIKPAAASKEEVARNQNSGLVAPEITEVLPNPKSPESDDTNEFIELFNPNTNDFDLTGYRLEAGTNFSRGHTFKEGKIAAKSYAAFYITDTKLQLSNGEGQIRLLDQAGTVISQTGAYEDSPDGSSWSLIGDSWQWSDAPTPGLINKSASKEKNEGDTAVTKTKQAGKASSGKVAGASTAGTETNLNDAAPLHPLVLAGVGTGAVAYAMYEYRKDMANRIYQFRRYLKVRHASRPGM